MNPELIKNSIVWEKVKFERSKEDISGRETFALEVSIAKDENYLAAFDFVKATVTNELGIDCEDLDQKRQRLRNDITNLEFQKQEIENEIVAAKEFHRKAASFFEQLGLNPADIFTRNTSSDNIPF